MKRLIAILLCAFALATVLPATALAVTTVTNVEVAGVTAPKAGYAPSFSATIYSEGTQVYSLDWFDKTADRFLEGSDAFIEGHVYEVQVWVEVKNGYEFRYENSNTPNVSATVSGLQATAGKAYGYSAWAMVLVSYTYAACPGNQIENLSIQLPGLTKSGNMLLATEGEYVPFSISSSSPSVELYPDLNVNRYWPYGFRWNNLTKDTLAYSGDRFRGGCDYFVTIAVTPASGSFADNLSATVNGKEATIKAHGATYAEVCVEVTCFGSIRSADLNPTIILPRDGNTPDFNPTYVDPQCKNIEYATVLAWYDVEAGKTMSSGDTFVGGKQYRVEVELMAAYPYKFYRDANGKMDYAPYVTGHAADSYSFGYDSYRGRETITLVKTFTASTPDHKCVAGAWQCDESGHERFCSICGKSLGGGAHWDWDGTETCAKGRVCEVCGYEFTQPNENHTPATEWTACGNLYHAKLCTVCGAHCTPEDHVSGPAATETTPQKCTVCDYVIAPAKNHKHAIKAVAAKAPTCTAAGNSAYYECSDCGQLFIDKDGKQSLDGSAVIPALGHTASVAWLYDEQTHWRTCSTCEEVLMDTEAVHEEADGACATCGYVIGSGEINLGATLPSTSGDDAGKGEGVTTAAPDGDANAEGGFPWAAVLAVAACVAAVAAAATVALKKKQGKGAE